MVNILKKTLIISGSSPRIENLFSGIFVKKRLEKMSIKKINFEVYSFYYNESLFIKFIKRITGISRIYNYVSKFSFEGFTWNFLVVKRNIFDVLFKTVSPIRMFKILDKSLDLLKYDFVIAHIAYREGYVANLIKNKYNIPYVLFLHGSDIHTNPMKNKKIKECTLKALEGADKCIFVSKKLLEQAKDLGFTGNHSIVIPNGFDPEIFYYEDKFEKKKELDFKSNKLVGFVGNLTDIKNVDLLPDIFLNIVNEYENVEFVVVGDGDKKDFLHNNFKNKGLKVNMTGFLEQKEVSDYMKAMDVLILPSKNEGWPCVIIEAQACGTYTIGSNKGGIPEAIGDVGKTFELNEDFIFNISSNIVNILNIGYDVKKILNRVKNYTWDNLVDKEIEVFKKINLKK
jgi:glycosyltransferase involved in cell wall biosynthesis